MVLLYTLEVYSQRSQRIAALLEIFQTSDTPKDLNDLWVLLKISVISDTSKDLGDPWHSRRKPFPAFPRSPDLQP